jgi:hypothetical protein
MKLSPYSRNIILKTLHNWEVPKDFAEPMYNYLVYGWSPGSCFTAVLANDFYRAIQNSHPANTIEVFKALVGWMTDCMPHEAFGSYEAVNAWCYLKEDVRRAVLEKHELIYTEKEEFLLILKGSPVTEPIL